MRNVGLDTDGFAAIWAAREDGEESESEILRRVLKSAPKPTMVAKSDLTSQPKPSIGFHDRRNGVIFKPGFQIFRRYKGLSYKAHADNQSWIRADNGQRYPSLN